MRGTGKQTIVWLLMGVMVIGLGGFGVTSFSGGSTAIGQVGDTEITTDQYLRAVQGQMQNFQAQTGQAVSGAQAREYGLDRAAMSQLFVAASLQEEADRIGVSVGDQVIAQQIAQIGAFQDLNGQFNATSYRDILRNQGLSPGGFEAEMRDEQAAAIIRQAALSGVVASASTVEHALEWVLESRDIRWQELTADDLPSPIAAPDDATLQAWHQANTARFTSPEIRKITYAMLTPEMLEASVQLDEQALRDLYQSRISEYQQPERRMVERLVFESQDAAAAAKARLDSGKITFEQLAAERGLTLEDADLGEVSQQQLGAAGDAVFALDQPGVVGPLESDLGPALFAMNAILEPVDVPFEQAVTDLRSEAAIDAARRQIEQRQNELGDVLAGGATIEDLAAQGMQVGTIDWNADAAPEQGSIAGYPQFRQQAASAETSDFPELLTLDDGGVFAMRLDSIEAPALIPFDQVRERVLDDWMQNETSRQLVALAEERRLAADAAASPVAPSVPAATTPVAQAVGAEPAAQQPPADAPAPVAVPQGTPVNGLTRDGYIENTPPELVEAAFRITEPGSTSVVDQNGRVFLVTLDEVHAADLSSPDAEQIRNAIQRQITDSTRQDVFDYFTRALQQRSGATVNQTAIDAANAQIP